MKKYNDLYLIRFRTSDYPYYQIYRGNFKNTDSAMRKSEELKADPAVEEVIVKKRVGFKSTNIYKWERGFEVMYLGR